MTSHGFFATILNRIEVVLRPMGYRRSGNTLSTERADTILLVQLQKSQRTTRSALIVTVNLGVFSRGLASKLGFKSRKPSISTCHWSERIGFLLPERYDRWWEIHHEDQAVKAGDEIADLLTTYGIPALERLSSTEKLRAFWASGQYGGLTEVQRQRYLDALSE